MEFVYLSPHVQQDVNCACLKLESTRILVNCPLKPSNGVYTLPNGLITLADPQNADATSQFCFDLVDFVLVTDARGMTALPFLTRSGFSGQIYATETALELGRLMMEEILHDSRLNEQTVFCGPHQIDASKLYSYEDASNCVSRITPVRFGEVLKISDVMSVVAKSSGSHLGAANWRVQFYDYSILLMEESSIIDTRFVIPMDTRVFNDVNSVLMLCLEPGQGKLGFEKSMSSFITQVSSTIHQGRSCLAVFQKWPIFFDLLAQLNTYFKKRVPIALFGSTAQTLVKILPKFAEYFAPNVSVDQFEFHEIFMLSYENPRDILHLKKLMDAGPVMILSLNIGGVSKPLTWLSQFKAIQNVVTLDPLDQQLLQKGFNCPVTALNISPSLHFRSELLPLSAHVNERFFIPETVVSEFPDILRLLRDSRKGRDIVIYPTSLSSPFDMLSVQSVKLPPLFQPLLIEFDKKIGSDLIESVGTMKLPAVVKTSINLDQVVMERKRKQQDVLSCQGPEQIFRILYTRGIEFVYDSDEIALKEPFSGCVVSLGDKPTLKASNWEQLKALRMILNSA